MCVRPGPTRRRCQSRASQPGSAIWVAASVITSKPFQIHEILWGADVRRPCRVIFLRFYEYTPFCNGPDEVKSPLIDRHVAELTLLSVVSAEAATLCCQRSGEPI